MSYGVHVAPGVGELFDAPMNAIDGPRSSFNLEAVPGGPLEPVVRRSYEQEHAYGPTWRT